MSVTASAPPTSAPTASAHCMPAFLREIFEKIGAFFASLGWIDLAGCILIALSTYAFGLIAGVVSAALFVGYKWMTQPAATPSPPVSAPTAATPSPPVSAPTAATPPRPVEQLPVGTLRAHYHQGNIASLDPSISRAHVQTCGPITANIINYFYEHGGFAECTPDILDRLLADGTRLDALARQAGGVSPAEGIDITDFFRWLPSGQLPNIQRNAAIIPFQYATFQALLYELLASSGNALLAGILWSRGHFTGLYITRQRNDQIEQIYVSESSARFANGFPHSSGGALLVPLGNTVEGAAERLTLYYNNDPMAAIYPIRERSAHPLL